MPKVVIAEDEFMNLDMIAEVLADSGYDVATVPEGIELGERHKPDLAAIYPHLADCGSESSPPYELGEPFLAADDVENGKPLQHPSLHLC
jgi:hypothetical protein